MKILLNDITTLTPTDEVLAYVGKLESFPVLHEGANTDDLATPETQWPTAPQLNQIQWPVWGMTRRALGHVLMLDTDFTLLKATGGYPNVDVSVGGKTKKLRVIHSRPLVDTRGTMALAEGDNRNAWVLTLSDTRRSLANILHDGTEDLRTTWEELLTALVERLGLTVSNCPSFSGAPADSSSDYFSGLMLGGKHVSTIIDAICAMLGARATLMNDGTVSIQDYTEAADKHDDVDLTTRGEGGLKPAMVEPTGLQCGLYNTSYDIVSSATTGTGPDWVSVQLPETSGWPAYLLGEWGDWGAGLGFEGRVAGGGDSQSAIHSWIVYEDTSTRFIVGESARTLLVSRGGGDLIVQEQAGTPSVAPTKILQFAQSDGFIVSEPSPGTALVNLSFGEILNVVTNVCPIKKWLSIELSGDPLVATPVLSDTETPGSSVEVVTGITVQKTELAVIPWGIGETACTNDPSDCCPSASISCPCGDIYTDIKLTLRQLYVHFKNVVGNDAGLMQTTFVMTRSPGTATVYSSWAADYYYPSYTYIQFNTDGCVEIKFGNAWLTDGSPLGESSSFTPAGDWETDYPPAPAADSFLIKPASFQCASGQCFGTDDVNNFEEHIGTVTLSNFTNQAVQTLPPYTGSFDVYVSTYPRPLP